MCQGTGIVELGSIETALSRALESEDGTEEGGKSIAQGIKERLARKVIRKWSIHYSTGECHYLPDPLNACQVLPSRVHSGCVPPHPQP